MWPLFPNLEPGKPMQQLQPEEHGRVILHDYRGSVLRGYMASVWGALSGHVALEPGDTVL